MKRWIALLLSLVLILSVIPVSYARPAESAPAEDVWETIQAIEDQVDTRMNCTGVESRAAAYCGAVDEIIAAVTSSSAYVPGSLVRHGDFFYWDETDGTACGYSPRLRAQIREGADPNADPEAYSGIETVSYATKGGSPSSVNVAAFQPYIGIDTSFTAQYENRCKAIAQALGGTATTYKTTNATIDNIAHAIESCAVVIFDSHGDTDYASGSDYTSRANTSYLCLQSGTGITAEDQATVTGPYGTYKHAYYGGSYGSMQYYMVDGTAISNHMTGTSPNGFLWMAICLGMATDGMHLPLRNKGVEVAYGYSQSVTFSGDYAWEGKFWPKMINGAYVKDAIAYMKQQVGCPDPYTSSYPAYPIVVSSEDVYPGHGNVDANQTVHSTWTLYPQYTINAVSNNNDWGTVRLSGTTITATPKPGYLILGYEVTEGEAEVTQDGNVFSVTPLSDCTVQINFAPRTPAVINFSTPDGVTCESISCYTYDTVTLPEPTGTPTADAHVYRFLGWIAFSLDTDTLWTPGYLRAGTSLEVTETEKTYYALYSYFVADNGTSDDEFTLLTEAPGSWAGYYVITYNGSVVLDASGTYSGTNIGGSKAAKPLSDYGVTVDGNVLVNVPDEIVYEFVPAEEGAYGIKMKAGELFLAMPSDSNGLITAANCSKAAARWLPSVTNGIIKLTNASYNTRWLQYNTSAKLFRGYATQQGDLSVYTRGEGKTWFTTSPQNKNGCENHVFGDWFPVTEPTCTEPGSQKHICAACGYTETEEIPALGHDYQAVVTEPTCTEGGYTTYTCSRCGDSYTGDETVALGHDYQVVVTDPTCTEGGYMTYTCSRCGDSYTVDESGEFPALGHDYHATVTGPTCTAGGYTTYTCSRCGDSYTVDESGEFPALGHDYHATVTGPTCTAGGYTTYTCSRCGDSYIDDETDALGHDYQAVVTEPTCTEAGYTTYTCTRCGDSYTADETAALGHDYQAVVTEPTCTEAGYTTYTCTRCGDSYTADETAALGHDYQATVTEPTCTEAGYTTYTCTRCGDSYTEAGEAALGHDWDEGVVTLEPTTETEGIRTYTCRRCGETKTEPIPMLEEPPFRFDDVQDENAFYFAPVYWAYNHNPQITKGTDATHFSPNKKCTRAEAVTFLWRAANCPSYEAAENPFRDVSTSAWYYDAVMWAVSEGITKGVDATHFAPNNTCSRAEIVTFLMRAQKGVVPEDAENPFADVGNNSWYRDAVLWAVSEGITNGVDKTHFAPNKVCTRGEIVTFLYRVYADEA